MEFSFNKDIPRKGNNANRTHCLTCVHCKKLNDNLFYCYKTLNVTFDIESCKHYREVYKRNVYIDFCLVKNYENCNLNYYTSGAGVVINGYGLDADIIYNVENDVELMKKIANRLRKEYNIEDIPILFPAIVAEKEENGDSWHIVSGNNVIISEENKQLLINSLNSKM